MPDMIKTLSLAAVAALATTFTAFAQETATPTANDLPLGEEVIEKPPYGATYTRETHGDWDVRCVLTESGNDPCQLYQLLLDQQGNAVAEINVFGLPAGQAAVAGATVVTPLETLLTPQLTLSIDGAPAKRYPFTFCSGVGCFVRIGFTQPDLDALKQGVKGIIDIVPASAPNQQVRLTVSLKGFTEGLKTVNTYNAAAEAASGN